MKFIYFFTLIFSTLSWSQGFVTKINNSTQILAKLTGKDGFRSGERVTVISAREGRLVAFGVIHDFHLRDLDIIAKIDITEIINNSLILIDDEVEILDFKNFQKKKVPGFNSITLSGSQKIPAQYKELVYMGVFSSDGHTLDRDEILVSPFQIQYGVTNNFGIKIANSLYLDGYVNLGAKYKVLQNKYAKVTVNSFGAYKVQSQDWIGQFGGIITIPSNAKFQTHLIGTFTFDPQYTKAKATRGLGLYQDSDIRNITEYITDNWNRVLFGPTYNFELRTIGGTVSYMWIWDSFHMSLGVATKNFADLHFGQKGYYYVYDFFWRF